MNPIDTPLSSRSDDEIRARARQLHEEDWVIEVDDDAEVDRYGGDDIVRVRTWIYLGRDD